MTTDRPTPLDDEGLSPKERLLRHYRRLLWIGAVLHLVDFALFRAWPSTVGFILSITLSVFATAVFTTGSIGYARSKGWRWAVGLLGLFGFIGLLVIWQLPRMPTRRPRHPE